MDDHLADDALEPPLMKPREHALLPQHVPMDNLLADDA
jgi:hypothetical protein